MENRRADYQFSDDSIRRFLLGQLQAGEQMNFEEQLFTNAELETRVRLAEFELADDYACKRLTESETESFRERYLLTADRNQKLNVSRAIHDRFRSGLIAETRPAVYQRLTALFDIRRPTWKYAFAALVLMLILVTVVLVTKEPRIASDIIHGRFRSRLQPTATPESTHHSTTPSSPAHVEQSPPAAPHESPLAVPLTATISVDQSPSIALPAGERALVRFQLLVAASGAGVYRADLLTMTGEALFSADSLKPYGEKPSIDFDVPASSLKSGQYQIRLSRTDNPAKQTSFQYYFRIQ